MAWVQGAEKDLEEKRLHCQPALLDYFPTKVYFMLKSVYVLDVNVVKAFESALALLGGV